VAERYIETHLEGLSSHKHRAQWRSTLAAYVYPALGTKPVEAITRMEVADVLRPIWNTKRETARRLVQRMERVFRYAKAAGLREGDNPASMRDGLSALLTAGNPGGVRGKRHHPALPWQQLPAFMAELRAKDGLSARALELAILTASRTGEVIGALWKEVDLDAGLWTVPAERMKGKRIHRKPLPPAALKLLEELAQAGRDPEAFIFPGPKPKTHFSNMLWRCCFGACAAARRAAFRSGVMLMVKRSRPTASAAPSVTGQARQGSRWTWPKPPSLMSCETRRKPPTPGAISSPAAGT
jgi:integrase